MSAKIVTNLNVLEDYLQEACDMAIEKVARIVRDKLEEFILEDFYNTYSPLFYSRTYAFLKSPKYSILGNATAEVFIDTDVMQYLGISGEDVANLASYGFHGSIEIFREGFYWSDFIKWCNENVPRLLKIELKKQGIIPL